MSNALTLQARALYDALSAALDPKDDEGAEDLDKAFDLIDGVLFAISGEKHVGGGPKNL